MPRHWYLRDRRLQQEAMDSVADMAAKRRVLAQEREAQALLRPARSIEVSPKDDPRRAA